LKVFCLMIVVAWAAFCAGQSTLPESSVRLCFREVCDCCVCSFANGQPQSCSQVCAEQPANQLSALALFHTNPWCTSLPDQLVTWNWHGLILEQTFHNLLSRFPCYYLEHPWTCCAHVEPHPGCPTEWKHWQQLEIKQFWSLIACTTFTGLLPVAPVKPAIWNAQSNIHACAYS